MIVEENGSVLRRTYADVGWQAPRVLAALDELAELAAQCEQWAYEDLAGVRSDVA